MIGHMPQRWSAERTRRELIRLTHRQLDTATLYRDSSQILGRFVAWDAACGHTMDPATLLLTRQFSDRFDADGFALVCRDEYLQPDVNKFASLLDQPTPVSTLSEATEGQPERSARFREILRPLDSVSAFSRTEQAIDSIRFRQSGGAGHPAARYPLRPCENT
jgi:hypothetical protein